MLVDVICSLFFALDLLYSDTHDLHGDLLRR